MSQLASEFRQSLELMRERGLIEEVPDEADLEAALFRAQLQKSVSEIGESAREQIRLDDAAQKSRVERLEELVAEQSRQINLLMAGTQERKSQYDSLSERLRNTTNPIVQVNLDLSPLVEMVGKLIQKLDETKPPQVTVEFGPLIEVLKVLLEREFVFSPKFTPNVNVIPSEVKVPVNVDAPKVVVEKPAVKGWKITFDERYGTPNGIVPIE